MDASSSQSIIEIYAQTLARGLRSLAPDERQRIVEEIRSHLIDQHAAGRLDDSLAALGPPSELARSFMDDHDVEAALSKPFGWELLAVVADRSTRSVGAAMTGFGALACYLLSGGFALVALVKPVLPRNVGLWTGPEGIRFGAFFGGDMPPGQEALGYLIIPVAVGGAFLFYLVAHRILRRGARRLIRHPLLGIRPGLSQAGVSSIMQPRPEDV